MSLEKREEIILLKSEDDNMDISIMRETYNKFNSITYSTEELNKFKDNILSLLKERDKIFLNKLSEYKSLTEKTKSEFNSQNKISNSKFSKIIDTQAKMTSRLDQLSDYENFVSKTNEKLVSHEVRLTNIRNDFSLATQKYDKIYLDNLELPGYIGRCAKYKNCQVFFLDVIKDLAKLNIYREKNIIDLKMYKDKLETIISSMNSILDNNNESQIKYINEMKEKILKDCKSMFEDVTDSMKDVRVENSKYAVDLIKTSMDLSKKWDKLEKIKEELLEKFNYDVNKYQMLTDDTIKSFEEFKNEYGVIRRKFMELAEFIKDVRFRKNIGGNVKKKEVKQMVKKMLKKRKAFENENVQLLSDITNIENIDYKKYYNIESNDEAEINNENEDLNNNNRSKSLMQKNKKNYQSSNNIPKDKEKFIERNKRRNNLNINRNNNLSPKEIKPKKEMNQSVEENHMQKIVNNNSSSLAKSSNKEKDKNKSSRSVNVNTNINLSSSNLTKKNNLNKINLDEKNIKNNLIIDSKNLKEEENYEQNKSINKTKNKDSNIIKLVKNNSNNNIELRNILDDNNNKLTDKKDSSPIPNINQSNKSEKEKINNKNTTNNMNSISLNNNINKTNIDSKPSILEDASTISEVKNNSTNNKDNKFSSEKSISFISDSNGNNINKFIINDINIEQNDKIIKELASELEQSTAKKDKFEQKFKSACNNIEPINLLVNNNKTETPIQNKNAILKQSNSTNIEIIPNNQISTTNIIEYTGSNKKEKLNDINNNNNLKTPISIKENNNTNDMNNNNMNNNQSNNNMIKNESINNLNPIKINNEIHLNDVINSNSVNKKLHAFDQKLLNLELYTKEKIIELITQINSLKQNTNTKIPEKNNIETNKSILFQNITPLSNNEKYKTFNNSSISSHNQNQKLTQHNSFNIEKMCENILTNDENNKNLLNINNNVNNNINPQCQANMLHNNNFNLDKKKYCLRNVNPKQSFVNSKVQKKNSFSYNLNMNNSISKKMQNNALTESGNNNLNNNILNNNNNNNGINNAINNVINNNCISFTKSNGNNLNNINNMNNLNNLNNLNNNLNNLNNMNNPNNINSLNNSNNININNIIKQNNPKEIIEGTNSKIIHSVNNEINPKFLKDSDKKMDNINILKVNNLDDLYTKKSNKSINYIPNIPNNRNNYNDSSFNGAEIKLVDLNKLVNHQLPRNRLIPIHLNENDYFEHYKSK